MPDFLLEQEDESLERIRTLAEELHSKTYKIPFWIYKNVFREVLSEEEAKEMAMTAVFEAISESDRDVLGRAEKIYKSYFWGRGTAGYDACRRATVGGKARIRNYADHVKHTTWGEEIPGAHAEQPEVEYQSLGELFELLAKHVGPEAALIFVLNKGYDWSISKIIRSLLGMELRSTEYHRETARISRLLSNLEGYFKDKI